MENVNDKNVTNIQDNEVETGIVTPGIGVPTKPKFFTAKIITIILAVVAVTITLIIIL